MIILTMNPSKNNIFSCKKKKICTPNIIRAKLTFRTNIDPFPIFEAKIGLCSSILLLKSKIEPNLGLVFETKSNQYWLIYNFYGKNGPIEVNIVLKK